MKGSFDSGLDSWIALVTVASVDTSTEKSVTARTAGASPVTLALILSLSRSDTAMCLATLTPLSLSSGVQKLLWLNLCAKFGLGLAVNFESQYLLVQFHGGLQVNLQGYKGITVTHTS